MLLDERKNTYSITFIDTEIEPNKGKILDIGAIKQNGNQFHKTSLGILYSSSKVTIMYADITF